VGVKLAAKAFAARLEAQARRPVLQRLAGVGLAFAVAASVVLCVAWPREARLPVPATEQSTPISSWARVDRAQGLVRVGDDSAEVIDGTELHGGDVIRTTVAGKAFVHLPDRSHLRVGGGSQLALTRSESDDVALTLERGSLAVRASHQTRKGFVVHSGGVSVQVIGTVFSVTNDAEVVEVSVSEGKVRVELPSGDTTFVEPGQRLRFDTKSAKAKRLKLSAAGERVLAEVAAVDDATTAAEGRAIVAAVGGAPARAAAAGSPPL
jgi:ferric-dicitrate binding protein FerR (iron transport regulator)